MITRRKCEKKKRSYTKVRKSRKTQKGAGGCFGFLCSPNKGPGANEPNQRPKRMTNEMKKIKEAGIYEIDILSEERPHEGFWYRLYKKVDPQTYYVIKINPKEYPLASPEFWKCTGEFSKEVDLTKCGNPSKPKHGYGHGLLLTQLVEDL